MGNTIKQMVQGIVTECVVELQSANDGYFPFSIQFVYGI